MCFHITKIVDNGNMAIGKRNLIIGQVFLSDEVAEWLRRWTANPLGFPRVGSNPILVVSLLIFF